MVNFTCNNTLEHVSIDNEIPSVGRLTLHSVGLIIAALFGLIAVLLSFFLMFMHATHYLKPWEQRHIIRILFMVPVYAVVSFLSFYFYKHYVYFQVIRDCYDAFAISSFFALLCAYIQPDLHAQKDYFRKLTPLNWLPPINMFQRCCGAGRRSLPKLTWRNRVFGGDTGPDTGPWRIPRSGLTWFNIIWLCIFQYCFTRIFFTIVSVITEATDRYCVESLSPAFAHVWAEVITAVAVTIAMYNLIQFYYQIRHDISEYKPFLKLLSIKLVIFFVFWQTIILSFLNSSGAIKASEKIAQPDITVGIPALLIDIEMAIFAVLHVWAYPWQAYNIHSPAVAASEGGFSSADYKGGPLGVYAFMDAFNPWDIIKAIGRGFKWAVIGRKNRKNDISYQPGYAAPAGGTPLKDTGIGAGVGIGRKKGSYEPLDGEPDEDSSYEAYRARQQQAGAAPPPPLQGSPYGDGVFTSSGFGPGMGPGRGPGRMGATNTSTEAFAAAPLTRPGAGGQIPVQGGGGYMGAPQQDARRDPRYPGPGATFGPQPGYGGQGAAAMPDAGDYVHAR